MMYDYVENMFTITIPYYLSYFFRWYKFDDGQVYEIDSSMICSSEAYILFYCRKY